MRRSYGQQDFKSNIDDFCSPPSNFDYISKSCWICYNFFGGYVCCCDLLRAVASCCEPLEPFRALLRHQRDSLTDPPIITCSQHSATPHKLPGRAATRRKPIKSPRHRRDHENLHLEHFSAFLRKTTTLWITHSQEESEGRLTIKDSGNEAFRTMPSK